MQTIETFWTNHSVTIISIGYNLLLSIAVLLASFLIAKGLKRTIQKKDGRISRMDATLIPILCTTATYLIYTIGIVFILDIFGVNTASLIALLGAAGLAIGFALKDTLSNVAAGIMLVFLRPYKVGDFIEFNSSMGTVQEINLFTTILETFDGLYISSPNSTIWGNSIKNYTRNGKRRMDIVVGISYNDSIDTAFKVLQSIIQSEPRFLNEPAPQVLVGSMGDSSINMHLRGWATVDDYWQTLWDLNKRVKEEIEEAGLTIPFPQREVHIVNSSQAELADALA